MNVANVEVLPVPISIVNEGRTAMKRMTKARLGTSFGRRYRPNARYIGRKRSQSYITKKGEEVDFFVTDKVTKEMRLVQVSYEMPKGLVSGKFRRCATPEAKPASRTEKSSHGMKKAKRTAYVLFLHGNGSS